MHNSIHNLGGPAYAIKKQSLSVVYESRRVKKTTDALKCSQVPGMVSGYKQGAGSNIARPLYLEREGLWQK